MLKDHLDTVLEIHVGPKVYHVEKGTLDVEDGVVAFVTSGNRVAQVKEKAVTAVIVE